MKSYAGTEVYMAPEIILREKEYNEKVDVWSAGIILLELLNLNGKLVFT